MIPFTEYQPKPWPNADEPYYPHQYRDLLRSAHLPYYALLHEQRTGKTRIMLDTGCYWYEVLKEIDTIVVVSFPMGVHRNWIADDCPMYIPERIDWRGMVWDSLYSDRKWFIEDALGLIRHRGLSILSVAAEAINTENVRRFLFNLCERRRGVMIIADEFSFMANIDASRTGVMQRLRRHPKVKIVRAADGTPVGNRGPLDLYSPFLFLHHSIIGATNWHTFKMRYAEWEKVDYRSGQKRAEDRSKRKHDDRGASLIIARDREGSPIFKNMDELTRKIAPWSSRVLRSEVFPHLKEPRYMKQYVELTPEQRRVYESLKNEYTAELANGETITAAHVLARRTRLHQVCSNYFPSREEAVTCPSCEGNGCEKCEDMGVIIIEQEGMIIDAKHNPRMERLIYLLQNTDEQIIIGAKFRQDGHSIQQAMRAAGLSVVRYWGNPKEKAEAKDAFQTGKAQYLIGNQFSLSRGHKLTAAKAIINYSYDSTLRTRLQFQDRPIIASMDYRLDIIDFIAVDTVDEKTISSLRANKNVADMITADPRKDWL